MSSALPKKQNDRVNTYGIVLIGMVSAVLLWVSVVALQAFYNRTAGDLQSERDAEAKSREVGSLKTNQLAELKESKFVNQQKGIVTIPIDQAEKLVLRDLEAGAPSLVPAIGPHDLPTVPAVWGKPADGAPAGAAPAGAAPAGAAPAEGQPGAAGAAAPAAGGAAPATLPPGSLPGNTPTPRDPSAEAAPSAGSAAPTTPPSPNQ